jgi:serine phosphatase RsbU (regulator of sigma subunit)
MQHGSSMIVSSGHILGQSIESKFVAEKHQLTAGDALLLYTDGLFENSGENGECLSRRGLAKALATNHSAHEIMQTTLEKSQKIWGNRTPEDDVTLVTVMWRPQARASQRSA